MAIQAEKLRVDVEGDTSNAQEALKDLESEGSKVPNWVGSAKGALAGLFGIGAAAGASFTVGLMGNISAADAGAKVSAQLALTEDESARVGDVAGSLFANAYGESIEEVNSAVGSVISSVDGMRTANAATLESATADVLNFANAFEVDVDRAAQIAGQAVRQGLAPDFQSAMDLMTAASQQVPAALREDLLDAVEEYGGFFTSIGMSGEEAFSALARGAEDGMYGIDKTGDAIKELTIRATDGSKATVDAYEAMGLSATDMSNAMLAGGDQAAGAFDQIVNGLLGIEDPTERANAAIALFGTPLEDLGTSEIPAFLQSLTGLTDGLGDTEGAAARMGDTLNSGPGVALTEFKRRLQDAFMGITDWALPPLMNLASVASDNVGPAVQSVAGWVTGSLIPGLQSMAQFVRDNSTAFTIAAGVIGAVFLPGLVAMGVAATVAKVKVVASWIAQQASAIASVAAQSAAIARTVAGWVLMGTQSLIHAARVAAAWVIAMGPVGWVIAAVVALVALIVANWETVRDWTVNAWGAVSEAVSAAWTAITEWVSSGVESIKDWVQSGLDTIQGVWSSVWGAISGVASSIWAAITGTVTGAMNGIRSVVASVSNAIRSVFTTAMNAVKAVASSIWAGIKAVIQSHINGALAIVRRVREVVATVRNAFTGAKNAAQSVLSSLVSYVRGIPGRLVGIFTGAVGTFARAGRAIINGLKDGVMGAFGSVRDAVSNGLSRLRNLLPFSPAKEGPFSGKGWTLYSGRSISEALAQGIKDRMGQAKAAALGLAKATSKAAAVTIDKPDMGPGDTPGGPGGPNGGPGGPGYPGYGGDGSGGPTFIFQVHNPVAEPASVTVNKTLARAAGLGW